MPDRMTVPDAEYAVTMSRGAFNWLVRVVLTVTLDAGPRVWPHKGRLDFGRLETLARRCRRVEVRQRGRITYWTAKDARTTMAILEAVREGTLTVKRDPPTATRALYEVLRWQVGDVEHLPGMVPRRVAESGGLPAPHGGYVYVSPDAPWPQ